MYDYYLEQPEVLNRIFKDRKEATERFVQKFCEVKPDRLYLIASGSSLNAALAAESFMEKQLGMEVRCAAASCLPTIYGEKPLMLFISQGGNSTNTIAAIRALEAYDKLALTGMDVCHINEICDSMMIPCGEEKAGPKTKGYTATVLLLMLCALEAANACGIMRKADHEARLSEMQTALAHLEESARAGEAWYKRNEETLGDIQTCVVVGKRTGAQTAREAGLKIQETVLLSVAAYEFEEFLHGPSMALNAATGGFYLMPRKDDPDYERMRALAEFHRRISPCVYMVSGEETGDGRDFTQGNGDTDEMRVFTWVMPCQITGALLTEKKGLTGVGSKLFKALDSALNIKYKKA